MEQYRAGQTIDGEMVLKRGQGHTVDHEAESGKKPYGQNGYSASEEMKETSSAVQSL
jgi:hypothetical protein